MHNLIRERAFNAVRIYTPFEEAQLKSLLDKKYWGEYRLLTWERQNQTLVWALKLENMVMLFLFTGMTVLVGLCVTTALMLFLDKIKTDLASFWVFGCRQKNLGTRFPALFANGGRRQHRFGNAFGQCLFVGTAPLGRRFDAGGVCRAQDSGFRALVGSAVFLSHSLRYQHFFGELGFTLFQARLQLFKTGAYDQCLKFF